MREGRDEGMDGCRGVSLGVRRKGNCMGRREACMLHVCKYLFLFI